ncbi:ferredoxin 3 [Actinidia rufa]|uniref:Ferredoxin 3 n=1 Tax=Actinidia rufa TaxID=165716 RepID=A0A7J0GQM0_9ERIC|nr:ferredoxin 3 [Actinidia rufa]
MNLLTNQLNLAACIQVNMSTARLTSPFVLGSAHQTRNSNAFVKSSSSQGFLKSAPKAFGLKSSTKFRAYAMAVYKIKLIDPDGKEHEFEAPDDDAYILDSLLKMQELSCLTLAGPVLAPPARGKNGVGFS